MFAPVATAFESAMGDGDGRNTWRTDRFSPCPRDQAAAYLRLLAGLGYQLSVIEQAVAQDQPYTGEVPPGQATIGQNSEPAEDTEPVAGDDAQPEAGQGDGAEAEESAGLPDPEVSGDQIAA
jgi:ParB family chromosome partitioning protein